MAVVKSSLFASMQGSVSDVTFRKRRNGKIELGQKHMPRNPNSTAQLDSRAGYIQQMKIYAEAAWVDMSQYERLAALSDISGWNAFIMRHQASMKRNPTAYWGIAESSALQTIHDFQQKYDSIAQAYTPKTYGPADVSILGFDAVGDHLTIANAPALNLDATDNFYFSCWIKARATTLERFLCFKTDYAPANYQGYRCALKPNGDLNFYIFDGTKPGGDWPLLVTYSGNLRDERWHFLEFVRDVAETKGYIYVDGELKASTVDNTTQSSSNTKNLLIGNSQAGSRSLAGDMRDITLDIG